MTPPETVVVPLFVVVVPLVVVVLVLVGTEVVVIGTGLDVEVEVDVAVGEMTPLTVWQSPVRGSMSVQAGERDTWARETSPPPGRRNRIVTSAKLAASDTWIMARLKRRSLIWSAHPLSVGSDPPADPRIRLFFASPDGD